MADIIQRIQFKRGRRAVLEAVLTKAKNAIPAVGEPVYETDTGQVKIGDGISEYKELPYLTGNGTLDPRFEITDPVSNQILIYDAETKKWVNKTTIFEHASDELIDGTVYHILWKVKPTALNTVYGIATDPKDGSTFEVCSDKGIISAERLKQENKTITADDINNLFN